MHNIHIVLCACAQQLRRWATSPRIYMIGLLLIVFLSAVVRPYEHFAATAHAPISAWLFPFLTDDHYTRLMFEAGIILLFCDAPFIDETQPFVIARAGRQRWLAGQVLYIVAASALYFLFIWAISILFLLPHITFDPMSWGKAVNTLAQTNAAAHFKARGLSAGISAIYYPIGAMVWGFLLAWLEGVFLGLLILAVNMYCKRAIGVVLAAAMVFSGGFIAFFGGLGQVYYFFPVTWMSLDSLDATGTQKTPPVLFAVAVLLALNVLLTLISAAAMRKKEIDVLQPV